MSDTLASPMATSSATKVWPAAAELVRHPAVLIGIHWLALALLRFPNWELIGPFVLLVTYLPGERVRKIGILNLAFVAVTGSLLSVNRQSLGSESYPWPPPWILELQNAGWIIYAGALAGFVMLYYFLFISFARFKSIRHPVVVGVAVLAGIVFAVSGLEPGTLVRGILLGVLFAVANVFWPMCYQLSEMDLLRRIPFAVHLGTLSAPWQSGWRGNIIVRGYGDYANFAAHAPDRLRKTQFSGVRLVLFAAALQIAADLFSNYFFGIDSDRPFSRVIGFDFSTEGYLQQALPRPYAWLFVFCHTFYFLLSLTAFTHAAVSIARMCGFDVLRNVYRPLEATGFNNFLSRIYFYYIAILQRFFFYPTWRRLRWIGNRHLRTCATVFITIFFGGLLSRAIHYLPLQTQNFSSLWSAVACKTTYFAMLGSLCAISTLLPRWPTSFERMPLKWLRGLWYCGLYALCYSTQMQDDFRGFRSLGYLFGF